MSAKYNTLFVFEGDKTEDVIVGRMERHFMGRSSAIKCVFGGEIYQLYSRLKEDDFAVDMVRLLKERSEDNRKELDGYDSDSFSSIYFFFDYDAHATQADDRKIEELISFFDNETENGKLFVSYPMVEAIRHMNDKDSFKELAVKCKRNNCPNIQECGEVEQCMNEPHYKNVVHFEGLPRYTNLNSKEIWDELIQAHLSKANYLVNDLYEMPDQLISQENIFCKQQEKYISQHCPSVAVLSAFPLFLQDYYGTSRLEEKLLAKK